jgi:hypothetical protein
MHNVVFKRNLKSFLFCILNEKKVKVEKIYLEASRGEVRWFQHAKTLINEVEPVSFLRLAWSLAEAKQSPP